MKQTHYSLRTSLTALLLCFVMLVGTTFAWFTDEVTSTGNKIQSGSLKVDLELLDEEGNWNSIKESKAPLFDYDKWEPGYVDVKVLKVENEGTLALKWKAMFVSNSVLSDLAKVIDVYVRPWGVGDGADAKYPTDRNLEGYVKVGTLEEFVNTIESTTYGNLKATESAYLGIALKMQETAGNEYQELTLGSFDIKIVATQMSHENDSYGDDYDAGAEWPEVEIDDSTVSTPITLNSDGTLASDTVMSNDEGTINVTLPAGLKFEEGTTAAKLNFNKLGGSAANITLEENEESKSYDVHVDGIAADNTVPVVITINEFLPVGLNSGNFSLYHVENGNTVEMTLLVDGATPVHNNFTYDPVTGDTTLYLASFSEVAVVANTVNAWNGDIAEKFASGSGTEADPYIIANADQMAYFSKVISTENVTYGGLHYKLVSNINFNGEEARDKDDKALVYYPAGYWMPGEGTNAADEDVWYTYGGSFRGVFDGNGNTISNIYQNTWLMDGDYDNGYWNGAMGIFAFVKGGTVKNLTVDSFSSDGEFTPTGCVAAYAAGDAIFENIAITNCNPRVYNTGNGGIIGVAGSTSTANDDHITLTNITVDNSNKISALWGSWDVACGGLVGMYRGNVDGSGNATGDTITFTNCHVSAQIDVNNDVCANYQYYAYRYSGMIIGSVRHNTTNTDGKTIPNMKGITATGCTVHFGTWNDYYYCELVANTTASYTHDYQMSRLTQVASVDTENKTVTTLKGETVAIPTSGRVNYVVVKDTNNDGEVDHATENATCYHFVDGTVWNHAEAGTETVDGVEVLVEDKQHLYLEFNNLVTGYGWGVTSKGVGDLDGVTILDRTYGTDSQTKFQSNGVIDVITDTEITVGTLFSVATGYNENDILDKAVLITVNNLDENGEVTSSITYDRDNWENSIIKFSNKGNVSITIQDYYFCNPTTIEVNVVGTKTVYFQNNWLWSNLKIYYWYEDGRTNADWPGVSMNEYYKLYNIYSFEVPDNAVGLIISGNSIDSNENYKLQQTMDLEVADIDEAKVYYISGYDAKGLDQNYQNDWHKYVALETRDLSNANKLYLTPNSNWNKDGAKFAVYFFASDDNYKWVTMSDSNDDDIYECEIPSGYTKFIFCRMNSSGGTGWTYVWNQTNDLSIDGIYNHYIISADAWSYGNGSWKIK